MSKALSCHSSTNAIVKVIDGSPALACPKIFFDKNFFGLSVTKKFSFSNSADRCQKEQFEKYLFLFRSPSRTGVLNLFVNPLNLQRFAIGRVGINKLLFKL